MDDEFDKLTEEMVIEKELHGMSVRAAIAASLVIMCADIYETAKDKGLPRVLAERMAKDFWDSETKTFVVVEERGEL